MLLRAEILFAHPRNTIPGMAALTENGFTVELWDSDPYSATLWLKAKIKTDLDDRQFFGWVKSIVDPCGGHVIEAGHPAHPLQPVFRLTPKGRRWLAEQRRLLTENNTTTPLRPTAGNEARKESVSCPKSQPFSRALFSVRLI